MSSQGETCTPTPMRARRFECRVSANSTTRPNKKPGVLRHRVLRSNKPRTPCHKRSGYKLSVDAIRSVALQRPSKLSVMLRVCRCMSGIPSKPKPIIIASLRTPERHQTRRTNREKVHSNDAPRGHFISSRLRNFRIRDSEGRQTTVRF